MCVCVRACARACVLSQSCPTLCDPIDHQAYLSMAILQTGVLEWVATPFSRGSS